MRARRFKLKDRTYVIGVLNITTDSFSDGGRFFNKDEAIRHGMAMARDGADIIDVGGESTRPGSVGISTPEELRRIIPVISSLAGKIDVPISIDTQKAGVAEAALMAGASIVNDVSGLKHDECMAYVIAKHKASVIVMHMQGSPENMQRNPMYKNLIKEIINSLRVSIQIAFKAGIKKDKIIVDPGIGFGKTVEHNLSILNNLEKFKVLGCPICVGTSRKAFIGHILNKPRPGERLWGTLATCAIAIMKGARILRVHDVKEAKEVVRITDSVLREKVR